MTGELHSTKNRLWGSLLLHVDDSVELIDLKEGALERRAGEGEGD